MVICTKCKKEMRVKKIGLGIRFGESHVYPGDVFECAECEYEIILTSRDSVYDPKKQIDTIQMPD